MDVMATCIILSGFCLSLLLDGSSCVCEIGGTYMPPSTALNPPKRCRFVSKPFAMSNSDGASPCLRQQDCDSWPGRMAATSASVLERNSDI
jgi:hypothetical protein